MLRVSCIKFVHLEECGMKVIIRAEGFDVTDDVKACVNGELERIEKMLPSDVVVNVGFKKTFKNNKKIVSCDIQIKNGRSFIRGDARTNSVTTSIDAAVDDLKRRLRKIKTHRVDKHRSNKARYSEDMKNLLASFDDVAIASTLEDAVEFSGLHDEDDCDIIQNYKEFELDTMSEEEAVLQMTLLGHSFYAFKKPDGQTAIVYRRYDGCGLITLK